jgi:hypothetical protein
VLQRRTTLAIAATVVIWTIPSLIAREQLPAIAADNLVALEMGGRVERTTSRPDGYEGERAIDGDPASVWVTTGGPAEVVLSFIGRDTALVSDVTVTTPDKSVKTSLFKDITAAWPKSVEIWVSTQSPTTGFVKAASAPLPAEAGAHRIALSKPIDARFVKVVLPFVNYQDSRAVSEIAVHEGQASGYVPLLKRHPDLASVLTSGKLVADPASLAYQAPGASPGICALPAAEPAAHPESKHVLIIADRADRYWPYGAGTYQQPPPAVRYFPDAPAPGRIDTTITRRVDFEWLPPQLVRPAVFVPSADIDTVVLEQDCDITTSLPAAAKEALVAWLANGNKLIVADSDVCGSNEVPDYSFLPYPFATSNPGARAAASALQIVERNFLVSPDSHDPGFLDEPSWRLRKNGNESNDLGDSNTVIKYDDHWCGALVGTNALGASGFVLAYAHYGRGLFLYDGIDGDQRANVAYQQYASRQLLLPFGPDPLPCTLRLAPFAVTTDVSLVTRHVRPGETVTYPLTVLATKPGFAGAVTLSAAAVPQGSGSIARVEPASVTLGTRVPASLTVTAPASLEKPVQLDVRATSGGVTGTLCLTIDALRSGHLQVIAETGPPRPEAARKNLLVILDLSGSMNLPLGRSTRIATARQVLRDVLSKLPDDFNVGLRVYGDRYGSKQKETCTDSHLVQPVQKIDRAALQRLIEAARPRGETPLVYAVLQAIGDLKAAGGGSVVLVTDGEESCGGDFAAATAAIRQSGLDFRLNIVGFTLRSAAAQKALGDFTSATGGAYHAAQDGPALSRAIVLAAVDTLPYAVHDPSGKVVTRGQTGDGGHDLPPGDYSVVVQAGDRPLSVPHATITLGQTTTIRVARKGASFAIEP